MHIESQSKRRQAIVHIGMHKTGTTAIQRFINKNAEAIQKAGLYWPSDFPLGAQFSEAHHYIPWNLMGRHEDLQNYGYGLKFVSSTKQRLQECPEHATLLLSSEDFDHLSTSQIEELAELLNDFDVKIICYVRRQDEFVQAMYQTDVVRFDKRTSILEELNDPRLDYMSLAMRWAGVFGKANLIVRIYEKVQLLHGNVVEDFLALIRRLGYSIEAPIPTGRFNRGFPSGYVELIRRLTVGGAIPKDLWTRANRLGRQLYPGGVDQYWFLSPSQRRSVIDKYMESNTQLARTFLDRPDGCLFTDSTVPWDDHSWEKIYGSTNTLLSIFLGHVGKRMDRLP